MTGPNEKSDAGTEATDGGSAPAATPESPSPSDDKPSSELTPEEQMALYEESLKDTDWGHQPC